MTTTIPRQRSLQQRTVRLQSALFILTLFLQLFQLTTGFVITQRNRRLLCPTVLVFGPKMDDAVEMKGSTRWIRRRCFWIGVSRERLCCQRFCVCRNLSGYVCPRGHCYQRQADRGGFTCSGSCGGCITHPTSLCGSVGDSHARWSDVASCH